MDFKKYVESIDGNPRDVISMDVPMFIRVLEFAREQAKTDDHLHAIAENAVRFCKGGKTLKISDLRKLI